jgi:DNA-binding response OmpR family regulator
MTIFYLCANIEKLNSRKTELNAIGFNLLGFSENMTLFKRLLQEPTSLLMIDLEQSTEEATDIERYLAINPELIIFILTTPDTSISKCLFFLKAGCNRLLDNDISHALLVENITAALRCKPVQLPNNLNISSKDLVSWKLNPMSWMLTTPNLHVIELTDRENRLIHMLALKNGRTVNKQYLAEKLLRQYNQNGERRIASLIVRLRIKVLRVSKCEIPIKTVHSIGYAFSSTVIIEGDHFQQGELDSVSQLS